MAALANVTVLILDDNPLVLKLGRALLEREGCTVLTASSWIEFNHVLASNTPDIIFLDVNLPSIKGNRLSEVLKSQSNKKDIPIVLISDLLDPAADRVIRELAATRSELIVLHDPASETSVAIVFFEELDKSIAGLRVLMFFLVRRKFFVRLLAERNAIRNEIVALGKEIPTATE